MPTFWFRRFRQSGQLTVFNKAGAWKPSADKALATFNTLGFPVKLVATDDEKNANIVVKLSAGADSLTSWGNKVSTGSKFDPAVLHGLTVPVTEIHEKKKTFEIIFAGIFLPGKAKATAKQQEVIIVHEFIHAVGLDGGLPDGSKDTVKQDHDITGVFVAQMKEEGDGLIEYMSEKGAKPMTPIRVGGPTRCKVQMIWGSEGCKKED
jgi:hypothetical protein